MFLWFGSLLGRNEGSQNQASVTNTRIKRTSPPKEAAFTFSRAAVDTDIARLEANQTLGAGSPAHLYLINNDCVRYTEVNQTHIGQSLCVFVTVNRNWCSGFYQSITFTEDNSNYSTDFRFVGVVAKGQYCASYNWSYLTTYEDAFNQIVSQPQHIFEDHALSEGCVAATGWITQFEDFPYAAIDITNPETELLWLSPFPCDS